MLDCLSSKRNIAGVKLVSFSFIPNITKFVFTQNISRYELIIFQWWKRCCWEQSRNLIL